MEYQFEDNAFAIAVNAYTDRFSSLASDNMPLRYPCEKGLFRVFRYLDVNVRALKGNLDEAHQFAVRAQTALHSNPDEYWSLQGMQYFKFTAAEIQFESILNRFYTLGEMRTGAQNNFPGDSLTLGFFNSLNAAEGNVNLLQYFRVLRNSAYVHAARSGVPNPEIGTPYNITNPYDQVIQFVADWQAEIPEERAFVSLLREKGFQGSNAY